MLHQDCRVSIWGVCTTRDCFELGARAAVDYRVVKYAGNLNPLSAVSESMASVPVKSDDLRFQEVFSELSGFDQRMLMLRINKGAFVYFGSQHADWVVLDSGALRFDLLRYKLDPEGRDLEVPYAYIEEYKRRSMEKLCRLGAIPNSFEHIELDDVSDEEFERCMGNFCDEILRMYDERHIILNEIYPVSFFVDGSQIATFNGPKPAALEAPLNAKQRKNMARGFDFFKNKFPQAHVIEFPCFTVADANNRWGFYGLHYVSEYYDYVMEAMDLITQGNCSHAVEAERLHELKTKYEEILREKYEPLFVNLQKADADYEARLSARIDIKNFGGDDNEVDVLDVSDPSATVNDQGSTRTGKVASRVIQSLAGSLDLRLRCVGDGELQIRLRGKDVKDGSGDRVPYWVDYSSVLLDGEQVLGGVKAAWHDRPVLLTRSVKDDQIVSLSLSWHSHDERELAATERASREREVLVGENERLESQLGELAHSLEAQKAETAKQKALVEQQTAALKARTAEAAERKNEAERQRAEVERLRASNSWKVGRALTWLPRKIKKFAKSSKKGSGDSSKA